MILTLNIVLYLFGGYAMFKFYQHIRLRKVDIVVIYTLWPGLIVAEAVIFIWRSTFKWS